jgi:DNA-binding CsgD family transcriptional regulator
MLKPTSTDDRPLTVFEVECRALALRGQTPTQIADTLGATRAAVVAALKRGKQKLGYETKQGAR